jgi:hypothetical protein
VMAPGAAGMMRVGAPGWATPFPPGEHERNPRQRARATCHE